MGIAPPGKARAASAAFFGSASGSAACFREMKRKRERRYNFCKRSSVLALARWRTGAVLKITLNKHFMGRFIHTFLFHDYHHRVVVTVTKFMHSLYGTIMS